MDNDIEGVPPPEPRRLAAVPTKELSEKADRLFMEYEQTGYGEGRELLEEAQFYLSAVDRRRSEEIARRDLWLEVAVIVLILIEIIISLYALSVSTKEGYQQTAVLENLANSTAKTTQTLSGLLDATEKMNGTLDSPQNTTETMNKGVHDQLTLLYEPQITAAFDTATARFYLNNTGRSNIRVTNLKIGDQSFPTSGHVIAPGANMYVALVDWYSGLAQAVQKTEIRKIPVQAVLINDAKRKFAMNSMLFAGWYKDKLEVHALTSSIDPMH